MRLDYLLIQKNTLSQAVLHFEPDGLQSPPIGEMECVMQIMAQLMELSCNALNLKVLQIEIFQEAALMIELTIRAKTLSRIVEKSHSWGERLLEASQRQNLYSSERIPLQGRRTPSLPITQHFLVDAYHTVQSWDTHCNWTVKHDRLWDRSLPVTFSVEKTMRSEGPVEGVKSSRMTAGWRIPSPQ